MMMDKNGREIRTGDVVRISGAYFKSDNGLYFVSHSPGDPSWSGNDYSLRKLCKDGRVSVTKYNVCFWPIVSYVSDREKSARARDWNREHAEIEVLDGINRDGIREYFETEANKLLPYMERAKWDWGKHSHSYVTNLKIHDLYMKVAASCG